jgi:hypothetical protein
MQVLLSYLVFSSLSTVLVHWCHFYQFQLASKKEVLSVRTLNLLCLIISLQLDFLGVGFGNLFEKEKPQVILGPAGFGNHTNLTHWSTNSLGAQEAKNLIVLFSIHKLLPEEKWPGWADLWKSLRGRSVWSLTEFWVKLRIQTWG